MRLGLGYFTVGLAALSATIIGPVIPAQAGEPLFGFVYTTDLLPKDQMEFEQWTTWRAGKAQGLFNTVEMRSAAEYGLTDALQVAAYANYEWAHAFNNNVIDGTTLPPESLAGTVGKRSAPRP